MNSLAFLLMLAAFSLCLYWYVHNYEQGSDGDRGFLLKLKSDKDEPEEAPKKAQNRGAEAVRLRAKELGIETRRAKPSPMAGRAGRIKAQVKQKVDADSGETDEEEQEE